MPFSGLAGQIFLGVLAELLQAMFTAEIISHAFVIKPEFCLFSIYRHATDRVCYALVAPRLRCNGSRFLKKLLRILIKIFFKLSRAEIIGVLPL